MANVLLIDDDEHVLKVYGHFLSYTNRVSTASTCEQALRMLEQEPECAQVIVSDFCMPDMESGEFIEAIQGSSNAPIVIITGFANSPQLDAIRGQGIHILGKPVRLNLLQQLVQQLASRSQIEAAIC